MELKKQLDGSYKESFNLDSGAYNFKLVIDGRPVQNMETLKGRYRRRRRIIFRTEATE